MLLLGRDNDDPLFLQLKEAQPSVLEPFLGKSGFRNHGRRVVEGQRLMQSASDIMLGWLRTTGIDGTERDFCPCYSVPEIDPVGAGDAFCAGLVSGLLDGKSLREAVQRGAALGAFCAAIAPMIGRLPASRLPPAPNTTTSFLFT